MLTRPSCAQVEVSFDAVARPRYIFDPSEVPATPLCPLTNLRSNKQNTGVWCWAASAQTIINYLGYPSEVFQWDIVNQTLGVAESPYPHANPYDCRVAEDSYIPTPAEQIDQDFPDMLKKCQTTQNPLAALTQFHPKHSGQEHVPLNWGEVIDQLCGKHTPYIRSGPIRLHSSPRFLSKEPRPAGRGFCKPRGNLSPLRYELPFLPALPSGASWQIFVKSLLLLTLPVYPSAASRHRPHPVCAGPSSNAVSLGYTNPSIA